MILVRSFIIFVRHDYVSSQRDAFATVHSDDLDTFDTRKVHLSPIPPLTVRARARDLSAASIANVAGPRRPSSLWNKGSPAAAKPRLERGRVTGLESFLFLSRRIERVFSHSRLLVRFSFARPLRRNPHGAPRVSFSSKGDDVARIRDTRKHRVARAALLRWDWNFNESKTSVPHEEKRVIPHVTPCRETDDYPGRLDTEKCGKGARKQACLFREP